MGGGGLPIDFLFQSLDFFVEVNNTVEVEE